MSSSALADLVQAADAEPRPEGYDVLGEALAAALQSDQRLSIALRAERAIVHEFNLETGERYITATCPELETWCRGVTLSDSVDYQDQSQVQSAYDACADQGEPFRIQYRLNRDDGHETWVEAVGERLEGPGGKRVCMVIRDITDRRRQTERIETLAFRDSLTGLPNRAAFQRAFDEAAGSADVAGEKFGLIMVDVDHFKEVNDTLGHDAGDALLKTLARMMMSAFRAGDTVARLGGDEFAVILRNLHGEDDMIRPIRVLQDLLRTPIEHGGQSFSISASIGAALHADRDDEPTHIIKNADIALYKAKYDGRNRSVLFQPNMRSDVEQRVELLRDIRAAIVQGEFTLFYQPVIDVSAGTVVSFEALMRWNHPEQGVLPPAAFMAAFEDQDLSLQLGEVCIDTALGQMRQWLDEGLEFGRVAINISSSQFRSGHLAEEIEAKLRQWNVPAERLTIEVTENVYMGWGSDVVGSTVRRLHDAGVMIALDDFGTGYASLANLRQFPIDRLKIDKSFVQNHDDDAIVRAVVNIGASLGMKVVAEGVETVEQLDTLSRYGCDQVQGYHFAKPMPAAAVAGYLKNFKVD
jgi:diguanylate cyclase (GGDEF)-like protein